MAKKKTAAAAKPQGSEIFRGTFRRVEEKKTCWRYDMIEPEGKKVFPGTVQCIWPMKDLLTGVDSDYDIVMTLTAVKRRK